MSASNQFLAIRTDASALAKEGLRSWSVSDYNPEPPFVP